MARTKTLVRQLNRQRRAIWVSVSHTLSSSPPPHGGPRAWRSLMVSFFSMSNGSVKQQSEGFVRFSLAMAPRELTGDAARPAFLAGRRGAVTS